MLKFESDDVVKHAMQFQRDIVEQGASSPSPEAMLIQRNKDKKGDQKSLKKGPKQSNEEVSRVSLSKSDEKSKDKKNQKESGSEKDEELKEVKAEEVIVNSGSASSELASSSSVDD